ncbi:MAG: hypothetical protein Q7K42_00125 [Candidatus Diapherotrites archaeon]|nr:hypothetical protein [Candidatus Diapherotrites archaeon]
MEAVLVQANNLPVQKFSVGRVQASVWENMKLSKEGEQKNFVSVSLEKSYKDKQGNWKNSSSFNINEIPQAILALQKTYEFLALKEK